MANGSTFNPKWIATQVLFAWLVLGIILVQFFPYAAAACFTAAALNTFSVFFS